MTTTFAAYEFAAPALRDMVRSAWSVSYEAAADPMPGIIAPDAHVEFVFQTGAPCGLSVGSSESPSPRAMIFALRRGVLRLKPAGKNTIMAFRVSPAVASVILRRPLTNCWDRAVPLVDLIGAEADLLLERIANTPQVRIGALLERWLVARLSDWDLDHTRHLEVQTGLFWRSSHRSMAALADDLGITARTLRRHCERYAGLSPKQVSISGRILRACVALRDGRDVPISHVAHEFGFGDQAAFTNAFHRYVTMTPGRFRAEPIVYCEGARN